MTNERVVFTRLSTKVGGTVTVRIPWKHETRLGGGNQFSPVESGDLLKAQVTVVSRDYHGNVSAVLARTNERLHFSGYFPGAAGLEKSTLGAVSAPAGAS